LVRAPILNWSRGLPGRPVSLLDWLRRRIYPLAMNHNSNNVMSDPISPSTSRREFLKTSTAAALGSVFAANVSLSQTSLAATETLRVGLIGCGGRGTGAANQALHADKNVVLTAMADVFEDQLKQSLATLKSEGGNQVKVDPEHCFIGLDAYQKLIDSGVDVVILATPPGFRPEHLQAAVAAGKHIFCEKPDRKS